MTQEILVQMMLSGKNKSPSVIYENALEIFLFPFQCVPSATVISIIKAETFD